MDYPGAKHCTKCGKLKLLSQFCPAKKGRFGRTSHCLACFKEYREANADLVARSKALSLYDITAAMYDSMHTKAAGLCMVCCSAAQRTFQAFVD